MTELVTEWSDNPWLLSLALALSTFASEDLACIAGGLAAAAGQIPLFAAAGACAAGIWLGDIGLYFLGMLFAKGALKWRWLARRMSPSKMARGAQFFEKYGMRWVFLSRFIPGSRVVSYLAAGAAGWNLRKFSLTLALAAIVWTPLLCGASMLAGHVVLEYLKIYEQYAIGIMLGAGLFIWFLLQWLLPLFSWRGRRLLYGKWMRLTRWEFWPTGIVYTPVVIYIIYLSIKHRGLTLFTASSPAIKNSGFAMDSKGDILNLFKGSDFLPQHLRLPVSEIRLERLTSFMEENNLTWPVVIKPDVGERGQGVAVVKNKQEAEHYLNTCEEEVIVQEYIDGLEYGIYYVRMPDEKVGRIFSLSCKHPQHVTGDGINTLEHLILADSRAVAMAPFYLKKFALHLNDIPKLGEKIPLAEIGTHARGSVFTDERKDITSELTRTIDQMTQQAGAIHCGRYDIKVPCVEDLRAGKHLKILELNGVTGEPAHVYQPGYPLWRGIADLCQQWKFAYTAGAQNRDNGHHVTSLGEILKIIQAHRAKDWYEVTLNTEESRSSDHSQGSSL